MGKQMTISKRFMVTCGTLLAVSILQAGVAILGFDAVRSGVVSMTTQTIPGMVGASAILQDAYHLRGNFYRHMLSVDVAEMAKLEEENEAELQHLNQDLQLYKLTLTNDADRQRFANVASEVEQVHQAWQLILPISREGRTSDANQAFAEKVLPLLTALEDNLIHIQRASRDGQSQTSDAVTRAAGRAWWMTLIVGLCGLAGGSLIAWFMVNSINRMLHQSVFELSEGAQQISSAATQVASSSQSLAQGASEQAASIQGTSHSTGEVNQMARRATDNSRSTADMVSESQEKFRTTNRSLEEMVVAMEGIAHSSSKIAKIIKVIDEIAFQTNILALNAAVEAARAGESGAGFAVVADEVRNLAQRSAQAARDTAELIDDSIARAHNGKAKVDEVASAIRLITAESSKMKELIDEINLGSQEQARGIDTISQSIGQMERVTQSTAAIAEESAAAAQQLSAQSETMKDVIERINAMVGGKAGGPGGDWQRFAA